jgi:purine-binding chemotaxis protein CheW
MTTATQTVPDELQIIRCHAAGVTYCLDMKWVESIERIDLLNVLPHTENDETGFVGTLPGPAGEVPVYSLATRLGLNEETAGELQRVIVLKFGGMRWGLRVGGVSQVTKVSRDALVPLPSISRNPANILFAGMIETDESLLLLLAPERLQPGAPDSVSTVKEFDDAVNAIDLPLTETRQQTESSVQTNVNSSPNRILVFSLSEDDPLERPLVFGLSVTQVAEVLNPLPLTPVPGAPAFVLGIARWRGSPVPVINLAARMGLPPVAADGKTRLMITCGTRKDSRLGFLIQPTVRSVLLPVAHRPCIRDLGLNVPLMQGAVELQNETLVIPDIQRILGERRAALT